MKSNQTYQEMYERATEMSRFYHLALPGITSAAPETLSEALGQSLLHYKNKYLKNIDHLSRAALGFYARGKLVPAYLMTRSVLEQVAFLHLLYDHLRKGKLAAPESMRSPEKKLPGRLYFSAFPAKRLEMLLSPQNCYMAIRILDRNVNGVLWQYQALNEFLSQQVADTEQNGEATPLVVPNREQQQDYQLRLGLTSLFNLLTMTMAVNDDFMNLLEKQFPQPVAHAPKLAS